MSVGSSFILFKVYLFYFECKHGGERPKEREGEEIGRRESKPGSVLCACSLMAA